MLKFRSILIPEMNFGQLLMLIRSKFLVDSKGLNKVQGKQFTVKEIYSAINELLDKNKFIEFGKAAKENSINFHWDKVIQKYLKILN